MKRKYLKSLLLFIALLIILLLFISNKTFASTSEASGYSGYTITSYDIDMVVNEDNTFDITEIITVNFEVAKHGIYREIPLRNTVTRTDGTTSQNTAKVSNLSVSENYTTSRENNCYVIQIGSSSKTITGSHTYTIKYTYDIGKDPLDDADELYYNLIGDSWDTSISNVSFTITMPKEFDESTLGFSSGKTGSTDNSNIAYTVNGNVISGSYYKTLSAGEALTVRLTLPEGYFVVDITDEYIYAISVIAISIAFAVIAWKLWAKYGKDDEVVETVEFYPPEGYNSAEIEFLYKGTSSNDGVISLLIYLANQGYLKIEETEKQSLFSKSKGFKITKLKEYDGDNESEEIFFKGLFKGSVDYEELKRIKKEAKESGEKLSITEAMNRAWKTKESVTDTDLYDSFYTTLNSIKIKLNSKENKEKIFEKTASGMGKWLILMAIVIYLLISIRTLMDYGSGFGDGSGLIVAILFPAIGFFVGFSMMFEKNIVSKIFGVIWGLGFGGIVWLGFVLPALTYNMMYLIMYIIGIICIAMIIFFSKVMPKRTPYGNEMLGKTGGFKRFLETAEKEQLEALVNENPEYFYNILPYTYALGVSDVWMEQFESMALQAPDWYVCSGPFVVHDFNVFMRNTMTSAKTAMVSSPSSEGGSSGGGFSGGGSGGGGGGSW